MPNPNKAPRRRKAFTRSSKELMSKITIVEQKPGMPIGPPIGEYEGSNTYFRRPDAIEAAKRTVDLVDRKVIIRKRPAVFRRGSVWTLFIEKGKYPRKRA
jgi:hypothetical protein